MAITDLAEDRTPGSCSAASPVENVVRESRTAEPQQRRIQRPRNKRLHGLRQGLDVMGLLPQGGPSVCNIAVTNVCNAACDFCGYSRDAQRVHERKWIDHERTRNALDILHRRGVRYLTFTGGEPTLYPPLADLIAYAVAKDMRPSVVTNGYTLTDARIAELAQAGLKTMFISIDSNLVERHEKNRGLPGVCARIRSGNKSLKSHGIKTVASVTINRLIDNFDALATFLSDLGFETVTFTYPKRDLGSSSLVFSDSSSLIDYSDEEMIEKLAEVQAMKNYFAVLNPAESLREMTRFLRQEEQLFPCYGGYKYFFMDVNFDLYRCDYWDAPMGKIEDFETLPFIRDNCTACMSVCYRDSAVFMHLPVALGDAMRDLRRFRPDRALRRLWSRSNRLSMRSLLDEWRTLKKLAKTGR